jgi:excisionase family DNA binding protein
MKRANPLPTAERQVFTIDDFCDTFGPGRSTIYRLIRERKIRAVKAGGRTLIPASEGDRLLAAGLT